MSTGPISEVTDSIQEEVSAWQDRPLEALYTIVYLTALMVRMRQDGKVENRAVYTAIGINVEGQKSGLRLWVSGDEGARAATAEMAEVVLRAFRLKYAKHQAAADVWGAKLGVGDSLLRFPQ